jgi:hypothetical protein
MLPAKRKPPKSGIKRSPDRIWQRHRKFVRSFNCVVPGCEERPVEFAHVRSAANAGMRLKPFDWFAVSMCHTHHSEQHDGGAETFQRKYGIDLWKLAAEFAAKSPDANMRAAMQEMGNG